MVGRPTDYTQELGDELCEMISLGSNFNKICKIEGVPSHETIYRWLRTIPEFRENYDIAREERAHSRFDKTNEIIEEMRDKKIDPQMAKIEIDLLKWQAGRENPKKYGDANASEHRYYGKDNEQVDPPQLVMYELPKNSRDE